MFPDNSNAEYVEVESVVTVYLDQKDWIGLAKAIFRKDACGTFSIRASANRALCQLCGTARDRTTAPLFSTMRHGKLTARQPMAQAEVYMMIQRRALAAGIETKISCHSFRATGITTYLQNGGKLEVAQQMAGHESARTTGLYDRRNDSVALDEIEKIAY